MIAEIIAQIAGATAASVAERLIAAVDAARHPHQDNTTIVAIRVVSDRATADV